MNLAALANILSIAVPIVTFMLAVTILGYRFTKSGDESVGLVLAIAIAAGLAAIVSIILG